jgi:hypothetical protein
MLSPSEVADVVELWVWSYGNSISVSQLSSHLETAVPDESIDVEDRDIDDPFESFAESVFEEIMGRQEDLGTAYPFACDSTRVRYIGPTRSASTYIFCLLLSHLDATHIENDQRAVQFETVAMEAAHSFFGGSALRIGAPWGTQTYNELLGQVIDMIPSLGAIDLEDVVAAGDRGWDILIVKDFCDNEFPRFVALGNCATGRNDWKRKGLEVQPDYFWDAFRHRRPGTWITFSAVPFKMNADIRKRKAGTTNLTFDRFRICELAPQIAGDAVDWIADQRPNAKQVPIDSSG